MKKLLFVVALVMLFPAWTGCNRGWPSCFCRDNDYGDFAVSDGCECQADVCEPAGTRYGTSPGRVEYVSPSIPTPAAEPLPSPGPASSSSSSGR
jgi:hypothetical protein